MKRLSYALCLVFLSVFFIPGFVSAEGQKVFPENDPAVSAGYKLNYSGMNQSGPGIQLAMQSDVPSAGKHTDKADEYAEEEEEVVEIADPIYVWNKAMYHFNDKFYFWLLKPVARGYSKVVPEPGRIMVSSFFYNLTTPIRFVNCLLQLKVKSAGNELVRLTVNSSVGFLGMFDVAKEKLDIKGKDEDFGQTLGRYKIGHGFYIIWPLVGPSSLRDTVGLVGDRFLHPVTYVNPLEAAVGITAFDAVNKTSLHIGDYEDLKEAAIDPYISIRDAYTQNRKKEVEE